MTIFGTIGLLWIVFTSALGSATVGYFMWRGVADAWRQRKRGAVEEKLDMRRQSESRFATRAG